MNKNTEKIQWQVCTREQANKLKQLGCDQKKSLYYWDDDNDNLIRSIDASAADIGCTSAYTVAELGEMLPNELRHVVGAPDILCIMPPTEGTEYNWCVTYLPLGSSMQDEVEHINDAETMAQAMAGMLIYLLENNLHSLTTE